jgi:hypothetical protein
MYAAEPKSNRMGRILPRALAACIGLALTASGHAAGPAPTDPAGFVTVTVTNCSDADPGSLRDALTTDADAIDLTQLSCSVITLTSGELATQAYRLFINGNGITISAGGASRVLSHHGHGTLYLNGVDVADGVVAGVNTALGGCLYSEGNLRLSGVAVHDCSVASTPDFTSFAAGGGIFARGVVSLDYSSVRDNSVFPAVGTYSYARGGGIYADSIGLYRSTVSGNTAGGGNAYSMGGGLLTRSSLIVDYSTISGNSAYLAGGAEFGNSGTTSSISNSTISGNTAEVRIAGLWSNDGFLRVSNSTIAFNHAERGYCGAGLITFGNAEYLSLNNSILANNTGAGANDDLCIQSFPGEVIGSSNIVLAANVDLPPDTIQEDPRLAPLGDNGGPTLTHALLAGSPAKDAGHDDYLATYDQRGIGFPRKTGAHVDLGAYEAQTADMLFANGFD